MSYREIFAQKLTSVLSCARSDRFMDKVEYKYGRDDLEVSKMHERLATTLLREEREASAVKVLSKSESARHALRLQSKSKGF